MTPEHAAIWSAAIEAAAKWHEGMAVACLDGARLCEELPEPDEKQAQAKRDMAENHVSCAATIRTLSPSPDMVMVPRQQRQVEEAMFNLVTVLAVIGPEQWASKDDIKKLCIELREKHVAMISARE